MEKIAELLYSAFESFMHKNSVQEPEGFSDTERQFMLCLDQEQKNLFRKLELLSYDYVHNAQILLIEYILKLIHPDIV